MEESMVSIANEISKIENVVYHMVLGSWESGYNDLGSGHKGFGLHGTTIAAFEI